jgi:hypothetical protein
MSDRACLAARRGLLLTCALAWSIGGAAVGVAQTVDGDGDLVPDSVDNCRFDWNADQSDRDGDGVGDPCDYDEIGLFRIGAAGLEPVAVSSLANAAWAIPRMATGHLDDDGQLDLAVANLESPSTSSIVLTYARGDGTFERRTVLPVVGRVNDVAIREVSGEPSKILVGHSAGFSVFAPTATGGAWIENRATGAEVRRIRSDANGILYVVNASSIVTIRLQPTGPPIAVGVVPIGGDPTDLAVGRDAVGRTQVAVSSFRSSLAQGSIETFLPTTATPGLLSVGSVAFPSSQAPRLGLLDLNGDGALDLVASGGQFRVFSASGAAPPISYTLLVTLPAGASGAGNVVTGLFANGPGFCGCSQLRCWTRDGLDFVQVSGSLVAACTAGDADNDGFTDIVTANTPPAPVLVIAPSNVTVQSGESIGFSAHSCPSAANGSGDVGGDGVPNTGDDFCLPVSVDWDVFGGGSLSTTTGPFTTLTAVNAEASGQIAATRGARETITTFEVHGKLVVHPQRVTVVEYETQPLASFTCPRDANGNPDLGPDGIPETQDDFCQPVAVDWSVEGPIGSVSPPSGLSTTFTAANGPASGNVVATRGPQTVSVNVFIPGAAVELHFENGAGEPTTTLTRFEPRAAQALRIRTQQIGIYLLQGACELGWQQACDLLVAEVIRLTRAILDHAMTLTGPDLGNGDVPATLTNVDAEGRSIEEYDLTLRPGSPVKSGPIVLVPRNSRILGGMFGNILFVRTEIGWSLRGRAQGFADAVGLVVAPQ